MATPNEICNLIKGWSSSGTNSKHDPAFRSFTTKFKNMIKAELAKIGATNIVFNVGHYYISGFFTAKSGQIYYFSLSDVRYFDETRLLYRTAKHYKDWTGGLNQWASIESDMFVYARIH